MKRSLARRIFHLQFHPFTVHSLLDMQGGFGETHVIRCRTLYGEIVVRSPGDVAGKVDSNGSNGIYHGEIIGPSNGNRYGISTKIEHGYVKLDSPDPVEVRKYRQVIRGTLMHHGKLFRTLIVIYTGQGDTHILDLKSIIEDVHDYIDLIPRIIYLIEKRIANQFGEVIVRDIENYDIIFSSGPIESDPALDDIWVVSTIRDVIKYLNISRITRDLKSIVPDFRFQWRAASYLFQYYP